MSVYPSIIVSGGQTGVDRAALDFALAHNLPCGGWCPKGRCAEDGILPSRYPLNETPTSEYAERTEWNVRDSDATLILTIGPPTLGTAFTVELAQRYQRPCFMVDFAQSPPKTDPVQHWLQEHHIKTLNVAGPRESKSPGIYALARHYLESLLTNETLGA